MNQNLLDFAERAQSAVCALQFVLRKAMFRYIKVCLEDVSGLGIECPGTLGYDRVAVLGSADKAPVPASALFELMSDVFQRLRVFTPEKDPRGFADGLMLGPAVELLRTPIPI